MINACAVKDAAHFSFNPQDGVERRDSAPAKQSTEPANSNRKEFLPRRLGESRFAPPQYVYAASRGGAVPT